MSKDYYKILDVEKNASKADIKSAYKKLAKKFHPDLNKEENASDKFKEINEAAAILGDDNKRSQYDQFGTTADGFGYDFSNFDFSDIFQGQGNFSSFDFGDVFDRVFGGRGRQRNGPRRGSDIRYDLEISLEDVSSGLKKELTIPRLEKCTECKGTGAKSESDIAQCNKCHGSGAIRQVRRTPLGMFATTATCDNCGGAGQEIKEPCIECHGLGRMEKNRKIEVNIPAGVETGTSLRISEEGEAGERGARSGDLYVVMHVKQHKSFQRDGNDIYLQAPISFATAALGGTIEVPTLQGTAKLKIPVGTQTNTILRLKGKGLPSLQGYGHGHQNVQVLIETPKKLNKKQKELLTEFEEQSSKKGLFSKIF